MLNEAPRVKREYKLTPQAVSQLEVLAHKIIDLVDKWRQRATQQAITAGAQSSQFQNDLRKYISKQTNHQLYIGSVHGFDYNLKEDRVFRVLLQAGTNVGGYFDDYINEDFLELLKSEADTSGVENTAKKFKVKRSVVRYAQETRVADLRPLRGRGDIVIDLTEILSDRPLPRVVDILTHELTHGVQTLAPQTARYGTSTAMLHAGEELESKHKHWYYRDKQEFEAQVTGLMNNLLTNYNQKGSFDEYIKELSRKHGYSIDALKKMVNQGKTQQTLKQRQQKFKQDVVAHLLNLSRETAMYVDKHRSNIQHQLDTYINNITATQQKLRKVQEMLDKYDEESASEQQMEDMQDLLMQQDELNHELDQYQVKCKEFDDKFHVVRMSCGEFVCSIAGNQKLWEFFKQELQNLVDSMN